MNTEEPQMWMFQPGELSFEEVSAIEDALWYLAYLEGIATEMGHRDSLWWSQQN